jgi:hypothetical protein
MDKQIFTIKSECRPFVVILFKVMTKKFVKDGASKF